MTVGVRFMVTWHTSAGAQLVAFFRVTGWIQ
jgi:hypothetical protein